MQQLLPPDDQQQVEQSTKQIEQPTKRMKELKSQKRPSKRDPSETSGKKKNTENVDVI